MIEHNSVLDPCSYPMHQENVLVLVDISGSMNKKNIICGIMVNSVTH